MELANEKSGENIYFNSGDVIVGGILQTNAVDTSSGGTKGLVFRNVYTGTGNYYNYCILSYGHSWSGGVCDGLHMMKFCTNSNTRSERMRIENRGNVDNNPQLYARCLYTYNNTICIRANAAREAILILDRSGASRQIVCKGTGFGASANDLSIGGSAKSDISKIIQADYMQL
jgi:hypothetical protein